MSQGVEDLSHSCLLLGSGLLQAQDGLIHELNQHGHQIAMVLADLGLQVFHKLPQGKKKQSFAQHFQSP